MKCPLLYAATITDPAQYSNKAVKCLKEECAWWDTAFDMCTYRSIARQLDGMLADMHRIAEAIERLADRPS